LDKVCFETIWANEFDKAIWETFEKNFPKTMLDKRSIREVPSDEIPDCDGIVANPPAPVNNDTIFIGVKTAYW
jgi:DNA (cytosine-5)-methyltransferase 1